MSQTAGRVLLSRHEEEKWRARHEKLSVSRELAGLFRGWVPEGFDQSVPRILYVGKATSGRFQGEAAEAESFNKKRVFWAFARQIARAVNCPEQGLPCIAWSNISKISCPQIEAETALVYGFEESAASTLESEIKELGPHVVVFVTGHFSDQVVRLVSHGAADSEWNKSENESTQPQEGDVWWKRRPDGLGVLWMRHPQFANPKLLTYAASKVRFLAFQDAATT